ncbi:MAG: hypothetical protein V4689_20915 [Verrucomicrobiota bacterium]
MKAHCLSALKSPERAHPLFPVDQVILWLPGLPDQKEPYCSYNEIDVFGDCRYDANKVPFMPPYPVSQLTYISWHTDCIPAFPFHPVPISRSMNGTELVELARRVRELADEEEDDDPQSLGVLHNGRKAFIYQALAVMGIPASFIPQML